MAPGFTKRSQRCILLSSSVVAVAVVAVTVTLLVVLRDHGVDSTEPPQTSPFPIIINTWGFANASANGWSALLENSSALDAVVAACTRCQDEQCDHTVGWGGSPDENGETTLDAMIMDGPSHTVGAVAALRNVKNVIGVARAVLEHTKHTFLVGSQATDFAVAMGFTYENLTSDWSAEVHRNWSANKCQPNFWLDTVTPDPSQSCGPYKPVITREGASAAVRDRRPKIDRYNHDTIGVVVVDSAGRLASGTSTNGARNKIPGRVGDSPIAGAGSYVDQEIGGAAATGDGDIIMRYLVSYQTVENLRQGMTPNQAAESALSRILPKFPSAEVAVVVLDIRTGTTGAGCINVNVDGGFPYMVGAFPDKEVQRKVVQCLK